MGIELNHTIVPCRNQRASAAFLADLLGRPDPVAFGPFEVVSLDNGVSLDFQETDEPFPIQHYAFLIGEDDFDRIFARIRNRGLSYAADPFWRTPDEINRHDGGRGVYFKDPDGHVLEVITRPYGSGG